MTERPIYNCHVHTFTVKHVPHHLPVLYLHKYFKWLGVLFSDILRWPGMARVLVWLVNLIPPLRNNDKVRRLANLFLRGSADTQAEIFKAIQVQYPEGARFVVLPMDMEFMDLGRIDVDIDHQHSKLLELAAESNGAVIPFYAADPRRADIADRVRRHVGAGGFRGVKIYPNLGYYPNDPKLMEVYQICQDNNVPVMSHCTPHGMWKNGLSEAERIERSHPRNYEDILWKYPGLRLCLAHFGGGEEWRKHLTGRVERLGSDRAWVKYIADIIRSDDFPNLYTDISYTLFTPKLANLYFDFFDYLKVLLADSRVREHVLFGSDYYAVEREELSEKEVSIVLRSRLGEDLFFQIAYENPKRYLGLPPTPPHP